MYGHQAIEWMQLYLRNFAAMNSEAKKTYGIYAQEIRQGIGYIQRAQHFHLGNRDDLARFVKPGMRLFQGECGENVRLPYAYCWFDWFIDRVTYATGEPVYQKKRGILAVLTKNEELNDEKWVLWPFQCWQHPEIQGWRPSYNQYLVSVNHPIQEKHDVEIKHCGGAVYREIFPSCAALFLVPEEYRVTTEAVQWDHNELSCLNIGLLLLSCKNITTTNELRSVKLNKKRAKNGKQPLFTYKILRVMVPAKERQREQAQGQSESHVRLHLCRGHFKYYPAERPLFGKLTGRYWWQPHVRGQNKEGIVIKDYEVKQAGVM